MQIRTWGQRVGTAKPAWGELGNCSGVGLLRLMAEILDQLRLVVYPIIFRVSYIPGGARFQPSTVGFFSVCSDGRGVFWVAISSGFFCATFIFVKRG